jgi:imidazolonepropionase-like amidohydrolase
MHLPVTREGLVRQLEHNAYYGVGAVLSLGSDSTNAVLPVREETIPNAARYRTAWRGITRPEEGRPQIAHWVNTEEEARAGVQEAVAKGADMIKIWVDDRNGQYEKLTPELYGAVIDEAHQNDLRVAAHIFALEDAKGLLEAGIDVFAHGVRDQDIDEEGVALFKANPDVYLVPNLPDRGVATDLSWLAQTIPADDLAEMQEGATDRPAVQETFGIQARNLARLNTEGVQIAFGTDGGNAWAPHVEMADMVAAGMTPAQVIVAATSTSAELLQMADAGSLEAGKSADFVVLDANPLEDITNTRQIDAVYLRGSAVDRAGISARLLAPAPEMP